MTALVAAAVPVAVVYGGPSAEHDVSIVSGTAIADALAGAGHAVSQVLVDLAGGWWLLPTDHRRDGRPGAAYDAPGSLGAAGPFAAGEATAGIAAAIPQPVVFVPSTGLSGRTARSRRSSSRPALPTPVPGSPRRLSAWTSRSSNESCAAPACRSCRGST